MKKTIMAAAVLAGILALGGGGVYAAGQIARYNAITEDTARNFAYADAGILPENAEVYLTEFDYKDGKFVYEIEFTSGGVRYDYTVDSSSGKIIEKDSERLPGSERAPEQSGQTGNDSKAAEGNTQSGADSDVIGIDKAKDISLKKAGLSPQEVVFSKAKLEHDEGGLIYDIEFYIAGKGEYDYEIDALTGSVLEESYEVWEPEDYGDTAPETGRKTDSSTPSGSQKSQETSKAETQERPSETQPAAPAEPTVPTQASAPAETTVPEQAAIPAPATASKQDEPAAVSRPETISVEEAKAAALRRAGLSASGVVFEKAKLEHDDGRMIYDIEFYVYGEAEYDYEIDAYSGAVLDEDVERWEADDD